MFLKTIGKNHLCVVSDFNELKEVFEIYDILTIDKKRKWNRKLIDKILKPSLDFLSSKNIISSIEINYETVSGDYKRELSNYTKNNGVFSRVIYLKCGFFQSDRFFAKELASRLTIKDKYHKLANEFLKQCPKNSYRVYVHTRRSDYQTYTVLGKSTQLPISYYKKQIEYFNTNRNNCFFIFLSDEPDYINREFRALNQKIVSYNQHYGTDMAIMTKCHGAILSPSSFGWWGAFLMKNRDIVVAPKYWLGFNSGINYHQKPLPDIFTSIEI